MNDLTARLGLVGLLCFFGSQTWAQTRAPTTTSKAMTIIFEPPKGQEEAFLNTFVTSQAAYMRTDAGE